MSIRLGIIGTGRIADRAISEIREIEGFEITAVLNPNLEHAREFADKYGIKNALSDIGQFRGIADAVYVASPHGTHFEYSSNLLKMGFHVICEKPMAFNPWRVKELYDLAAEKKLVLMEGIKTAYCPGFKKIEEIISGGAIGEVVDVEAAFTRLTPEGCREYDDKEYGGSFTEFGTYTMLPVLRFLGTERFSVSFMCRYTGETDGYTKTVFDYEDRFACAKTGLDVKSEGQLLIAGTKGYLIVPSPWWLTKYFEVRYEDPAKIDKYECEFEGDGLRYEFAEFTRRISEGISSPENEKDEAMARGWVYEMFMKNRTRELSENT